MIKVESNVSYPFNSCTFNQLCQRVRGEGTIVDVNHVQQSHDDLESRLKDITMEINNSYGWIKTIFSNKMLWLFCIRIFIKVAARKYIYFSTVRK